MNKQFALLQSQLAGMDTKALDRVREGNSAQGIKGFRQMIHETGNFRIESVRAHSAVENFTTALQKRDVTVKTAAQNMKNMNAVLREQYALQQMQTMAWKQDARGRIDADAIMPAVVPERLGSLKKSLRDVADGTATFGQVSRETAMRVGLMSEVVRSAGHNMVNLGKNTQWAGRQMMVGLGVPFAAFGVAAGTAAYEVDKEMTRIVKVYDYATEDISGEQQQLKADSMATAKEIARAYGMAAEESLNITAAFAATGKTGVELQQLTKEVAAASLLGELDRQKAIDTTISLSTVLADTNYDVAESFRYMNALENATSLSMQDMTEAVPLLAGVVEGLGGDITDIGTLMAAGRAAGLDASQAANALKSISFRNVAPTDKAVETFERLTKVNFQGLIEQTQGDVIPMIRAINEAMDGLSNTDRIKVVRDLQGLWQGSKFLNIADQFGLGPEGASEMVTRAEEVAQMSGEAWNETWNRELLTVQESASGQFKRAVATLKTELADAGTPFLEVATTVAKAIGNLLASFNGLSEGRKKALLMAAGIVAVGTVGVMLLGVFMNLIGTVVKFSGSMGMLATRFKSTTMEQKISELAARSARGAYLSQADSARVLAFELGKINVELEKQAAARAKAAGLPFVADPGYVAPAPRSPVNDGDLVGGVYQDRTGATRTQYRQKDVGIQGRHDRGSALLQNQYALAHDMAIAEDARLAKNARLNTHLEKANRLMSFQRGALLSTVGMTGQLVGLTDGWAGKLTNVLMIGGLLLPMFGAIYGKIATIGVSMAGRAGLAGRLTAAGPALARLTAMAGPLGLALAAAGAGAMFIHAGIKKSREEMERVNNSAKDWAGILNFEYTESASKEVDAEGKRIKTYVEQVNELREANKHLVEDLEARRGDSRESNMDRAMQEGLKVALHGGTKEAAEEAAVIAFQIMEGKFANEAERKKFLVQIGVDFGSTEDVVEERMNGLSTQINDAMSNLSNSGKREDFVRLFSGRADLTQASAQSIRDAAKEMWNVYNEASEENKYETFLKMKEGLESGLKEVWSGLSDETKGVLAENGVKTWEAFRRTVNQLASDPMGDVKLADMGLWGDDLDAAKRAAAGLKEGMKVLGREAGMTDEEMEKLTFSELAAALNIPDAAAIEMSKVADETKKADDAMVDAAAAADELRANLDGMAESAAQGAMNSAMNSIEGIASDILDERLDAQMDALKDRGDATMDAIEREAQAEADALETRLEEENRNWKASQDAFKAHWDERRRALEEGADAQIKKAEEVIDAERKAEQERQAIFEREKMRIQRLADLYNQNLDFNIALQGGDLDEAARLGNNVRATTEGWAMDDAASGAVTASEKRIAESEQKIELLNAEKDAAIEALAAEEEAAKRKAEAEHERRKQALEDEKEMNKQALEDRKAVENAKQEKAEETARRSHDALKRALEADLAAWSAYIPHNQEDLNRHIGVLEGIYKEHGISLNKKSAEWGAAVNAAIHSAADAAKASLQSDINWAMYGAQAAADFIQGAFQMDMNTFKQTFGIPGSIASVPGATGTGVANNRPIGGMTGPQAFHEGGRIGMTGSGRTGYPVSAQRRPSEVDTRLKVGEFVVRDKAVRKLGLGTMNQINNGVLPAYHEGGAVGASNGAAAGMGMPGVMGMMLVTMMKSVLTAGMNRLATGFTGSGVAQPGQYGDSSLDAEQLANAMAIVNTGRAMRMTDRDIMIGLMTALQESSLRNVAHGDQAGPDSRGLFQQRAPWGPQSVRMDPNGSARLFFEALKKVENRNQMPLTMAAQKVQRSAHPNAYAKWQDEAQGILNALGGSLGGGAFQANGKWPAPQYGRVSPNTQAAANFIRARFGINNIGLLGQRANKSDHPYGKALDAMIPNYKSPQGIALGNAIASYFVENPDQFGTKYVIWRQMINSGRGWRRMENRGSDTANHLDHPHISFKHEGGLIPEMRKEGIAPRGMGIPQLFTGGHVQFDNTLANLHRDETVLTAPLSSALERGINNIDGNGGNRYDITMDFRGATVDSNFDIAGALEQAINKRESRLGRNRKIG